jgi:hypothetical protein
VPKLVLSSTALACQLGAQRRLTFTGTQSNLSLTPAMVHSWDKIYNQTWKLASVVATGITFFVANLVSEEVVALELRVMIRELLFMLRNIRVHTVYHRSYAYRSSNVPLSIINPWVQFSQWRVGPVYPGPLLHFGNFLRSSIYI